MTTHGPRFHGGYQHPDTSSAPATRSDPLDRYEDHERKIKLTVCRLEGGRPGFMIDLLYEAEGTVITARTPDGGAAQRAFQTTRAALQAGEHPEHVLGL